MLKRVALLGSIAAATVLSASSAGAQYWGGGPVNVTVSAYPYPPYPDYPPPPPFRHYYHREGWWWGDDDRWGGDGPFFHRHRLPYFWGDNFEPYGYGYRAQSYHSEAGYRGAAYDDDE